MLRENYNKHCLAKSDINEHLPTLKKYSEKCDTIIEMGVRTAVSTWGLLSGNPKRMISIDIKHPKDYGCNFALIEEAAKENEIEYHFVLADTTKIEIQECDLLFIDTLHTYKQLKQELMLHGNKAKKYLIFHDTTTFGERDAPEGYQISKDGPRGLIPAIQEFLKENTNWSIEEVFTNNNGLTVLKNIETES